MKLIIGVGNPDLPAGRQVNKYQNTRHNVGFMFVDYLAQKLGANEFEFDKKSNSFVSKAKLEKTQVVLAKPQTYVNKSGEAVKKLIENWKLSLDFARDSELVEEKIGNLVIVHDDLDVPFGNVKLSFDRNSGGHKGVESIMKALKTKKFYRLRIGLAKPALAKARRQTERKRDEFVRNYVLSKFSKSETEKLKEIFKEGYEKLISNF